MLMTNLATYQAQWAYQKYWVMAHSQQHYNQLRLLFKGNDWSQEKAQQFDELIAEAERIEPSTKTLRTAYQHVWGYFKKSATPSEKERFKELDDGLEDRASEMLVFLQDLTALYQPTYLQQSRLILEGV
ncbi:hypothetical protein AKK44_06615 [Streptococcus phocae]|uniref:DUF1722 domain-containing protein n=2 Tax=Streptococcus phocae TaxID=119224 RepID=A0A0P6S439_9STRE|nr:YbgA family protein [Streptococcus phocae]KGR72469.1 hypothetical protein NX86_06040 [Streptococcus phocae subsp. salmonis]KPJ22022.1 hypothetical protein AKK44_06615 [Streptococcus phocae]